MTVGSLIIVTCTMGWNLPLVWPIVLSAAGALGYKVMTNPDNNALLRGDINKELTSLNTVELKIDHEISEVVESEVKRDEVLRFTKDDIILVFKKNLRGKFSIEVSGPNTRTKHELKELGNEFLSVVVQQFSYNRMAEQMERRGANIIGEEVTEEGDIILKLRRWE